MKTEVFDNAADFMKALKGGSKRGKKQGGVKAKSGEGDRQRDLDTLAAAGWICTHYHHATGEHFMTNREGRRSACVSSYRALLDMMLKGETQ